jgi:hypothetical protein
LVPDGTIHGVTYVKTKDFVQVSGTGDLTKINIAPGDAGGQFDSAVNTPEEASVKVDGQSATSWVVSDIHSLPLCPAVWLSRQQEKDRNLIIRL